MTKQRITHAISIRQPWAHLIAAGLRPVELRTWPTSFRGTIAIHAGMSPSDMNDRVLSFLCNMHPDMLAHLESYDPDEEAGLNSWLVESGKKAMNPASQFHFGAIIGTVDIVDCLTVDEAIEAFETTWKADGERSLIDPCDWITSDSGYVWLLKNAKLFAEPIPAKGVLRIFKLSTDLQVAATNSKSIE